MDADSRFGAHMSAAGGVHKAVHAAKAVGFGRVQVFTKNNNRWLGKALDDAQIDAFKGSLRETGVVRPVAHNSYLINLGSPDDGLWEKSIAAMVDEVERAEALGIPDLVAHPGAHVGSGEDMGLARIARGLDEVHRRTAGATVKIDLETTAGQGTCLGHRFEHLGRLFDSVAEPERLGVCVDTCHIFAAGYALGTAEEYDATMRDLDREVGVGRVRLWHLNDSVRGLGSRVDRHAGIGRGCLGVDAFRNVVNDPRFFDVPMVLETPKGVEDGVALDAINLGLLRSLIDASAAGGPG